MNAKKITLVGIFLALSTVALFLAGVIPGIELTLFAVAGLLVMLVIKEAGIGSGVFLYVTSLLLGLLIIPNKFALLVYAFFFGPYSIFRELIERIPNKVIQYILKFLTFNLLVGVGVLIFKEAFFTNIGLPGYAIPVLVFGAEIMFLVYDTILGLAVKVVNQTRGKK